ncbi:hypothetical protein RSA46_12150 [Pseudomonas oryzihabitans]|uniref:GNAT family N-acetyltransferase n=1 Tax=Pseudomonas rhizoryzae TaxID=2571129 RepID=UPI0007371E7E|nr:hypothetical protein [Pseudomonas rhizoryzae]KTT28975.1 hypothetical protein SB9_22690 [Pseudomonas psychrotolerans]KTT34073.1 hypothetical protein NS201_03545 [Pseudomonas psychrotolerans]KTT37066.1 hypothetical protein SB5_20510 [Pseudomonas psychrotolerans]KTT44412.1 hypothetical protein RSA46_12150 [Pseudomonas psychrotolerans]KTT51771.1 hypothetical protein SB11R_04225 [Pseudomonas psychrotolerans]
MTRLLEFFSRLRRKGLLGSLRVLGERLGCYCWTVVLLERDLVPPKEHRRRQDLRVVEITPDLLPAVSEEFNHYGDNLTALMNGGYIGYAILTPQDQVAGMTWVTDKDYYDDQLYRCLVPVPPACAYQFAGEIAPAYRRTGAVVVLLDGVWRAQRQRGMTRTRALVNRRNLPALKLHVGLDFQELGQEVQVFCLFGCLHYHRWRRYQVPSLAHVRRAGRLSAERSET